MTELGKFINARLPYKGDPHCSDAERERFDSDRRFYGASAGTVRDLDNTDLTRIRAGLDTAAGGLPDRPGCGAAYSIRKSP